MNEKADQCDEDDDDENAHDEDDVPGECLEDIINNNNLSYLGRPVQKKTHKS